MLDIAWTEMMLVAVVAIVVIGPKELPFALRAVGRWVGKARSLAREFQSSVDDMIAETELQELRETAQSIQNFDADNFVNKQMDPTGPDDDDDDEHSFDATDEEMAAFEADLDRRDHEQNMIDAAVPSARKTADVSEDFVPPTEAEPEDAVEPEPSKEA
jgi:sec-independent protein translocase protein TatB